MPKDTSATPPSAQPGLGHRKVIAVNQTSKASVGTHLLVLSHQYTQQLTKALHDNRITAQMSVPRLQTLRILKLNAPTALTGAEISRAIGMTPQTLSNLLTFLFDLGWVTCETQPKQGRAVFHSLTAEGSAVLRKAEQIARSVDAQLEQPDSLLRNQLISAHRTLAKG